MFNVDSIVEKWLQQNKEAILKNISDTIVEWLDKNKDEIYKIIDKNTR